MPLSPIEHIDSVLTHLNLVRNNCITLGKRLIERGREKIGRELIARGLKHDVSKLENDDEWMSLHAGKDVPKDKLQKAIEHHRSVNDHHFEFWKNTYDMPEICVAEMTCDIMARCQEFGEGLREWIAISVIEKYQISKESNQYNWINQFVEILLENEFVK